MKNKINMFLLLLSLFLVTIILPSSLSVEPTHEISTFEDLVTAANLSKLSGYNDDTYILKNDIVITDKNQQDLENSDFKYISFGSSEYPFIGTFDGNGYAISNLKYSSDLSATSDTGLFKVTGEGAIIKNLIIDKSNLEADYRGGIVAGYSEGTTFENITVQNSELHISASNNVLTLITDGGIRAGAIVGEAVNSVLYNCESRDNLISTDNTAAITALSGKNLSLGGLVGNSTNTLIEYSRVYGGKVINKYDVAIGIVGGNTLYVGGIVGRMLESSKVIDSFSTAHLEYYCATYLSLINGNVGHIGGITASMENTTNEIIRSHYAGTTSSTEYNAVLVIPVIRKNVNISGLADVYEGGSVINSYFKPSLNPDVEMMVLGNNQSTSSYGSIEDDEYGNRQFWSSQFYDMSGIIKRTSAYSNEHYNRWIVDTNLGIPIHGKSVSATLDFKGAGSVTIDKTELVNAKTTTDNPYFFAVQGLYPYESIINLETESNDGYRFIGWYKQSEVVAYSIEEKYNYFEKIFADNQIISNNKEYNNVVVGDNDLFIAHYQAHVLFHDINGNTINIKDGSVSIDNNNENNWYNYETPLPNVEPINKPVNENVKLIGWTSEKSTELGGGYHDIATTQLTSLKSAGTFYETGDKITSTLSLYPVYISLLANINTVFEGNELDSSDNLNLRENVGTTHVYKNDDGNAVIEVIGVNENGTLPVGYRFLGWYNEDNIRISSSMVYVLKDLDLTHTHTFTAKFEYLVEYYARAYDQGSSSFEDSYLYDSRWHRYNSNLVEISGPSFVREEISHWGNSHVNHGSNDNLSDKYTGTITSPIKVYSHNHNFGSNLGYAVLMDTDFPDSGTITNDTTSGTSAKYLFTPKSDRYKLLFWTFERSGSIGNSRTYANNPMNSGTLNLAGIYKYGGRAIVKADVYFHQKDDSIVSVSRRYGNTILMSEDQIYTYNYPHYETNKVVDTKTDDNKTISSTITLEKSPSNESMKIDGYAFLGWISSSDILKDSEEWNKIYDVVDDLYCTSNVDYVLSYLVDANDLVTEAHDLYPVYAKYNITTKINIPDAASSHVNIPENPSYTITETGIGKAEINILPDLDVYIIGSNGEKYILASITKVYDDKTEEIISTGNNDYKYNIVAGHYYTFIANYEPYILVYHLDDNETSASIKNKGNVIGKIPEPSYNVSNRHLYVGYTIEPSNSGYHSYTHYKEYLDDNVFLIDSSTYVSNSMELWPVYVATDLEVKSNIDDYLSNNSIDLLSIRTFVREGNSNIKLSVKQTSIGNYRFIGWYKDYKNIDELGELISINSEITLSKIDSLSSNNYTAVYKEANVVNYFGIDGSILYTVDVYKDEPRSFISTIVDENGNDNITLIDYEAFELISNSLPSNENFINWHWIKSDGSLVEWNDYYDKQIESDMNLYPITNKVTLKDSNNNALTISNINSNEADIIIGINNNTLVLYLNRVYTNDKLIVQMDEITYTNNEPIIVGKSGINTVLYAENLLESNILAEDITDSTGHIVFNLDKSIIVYISDTSDVRENNYFIYKIVESDNPENTILNFVLTKDEIKKIRIPYGKYKIVPSSNWTWKYSGNQILDLEVNNYPDNPIKFEINLSNEKWFNDMDLKKND